MPFRRLRLLPVLLALLGAAAALAWALWPEEPPPAVEAVAVPAPRPLAPAPPQQQPAAMAAAAPTVPDCPATPPPLRPHDEALALQRAVAVLASGTGGDPVAALLLQKPAGDDAAALAAWAGQVRMAALRSQDAQALRWAGEACAWTQDAVACRRELLRERLRLEPDNALHWLAWLDEDPAAADEAWRGLAAARYWHEAPQRLAERVGRALPPALLPAQREALLQPLQDRVDSTGSAPLPPTLSGACGHFGPEHAIGAACAHVATLMLSHSDSPQAWQQGAELARQLGRDDVPQPPPAPSARVAGCAAK